MAASYTTAETAAVIRLSQRSNGVQDGHLHAMRAAGGRLSSVKRFHGLLDVASTAQGSRFFEYASTQPRRSYFGRILFDSFYRTRSRSWSSFTQVHEGGQEKKKQKSFSRNSQGLRTESGATQTRRATNTRTRTLCERSTGSLCAAEGVRVCPCA